MLHRFYPFIIDILYPKYCVSCKSGDSLLCNSCKKLLQSSNYSVFNNPTNNLDFVIVSSDYHNKTIQSCIKAFKFSGIRSLAYTLSKLIIEALKTSDYKTSTILVPIPLHPRRLCRRGYNQSELLTNEISSALNLKIDHNLKRRKFTQTQSNLKESKRYSNMKNVFKYTTTSAPKQVMLIDDVSTTFSTLEAAAKELKQNGAESVGAAVIAKNL